MDIILLRLARALTDNDQFADYNGRSWVCKHCGARKDPERIIEWTHADHCPVGMALQIIEDHEGD